MRVRIFVSGSFSLIIIMLRIFIGTMFLTIVGLICGATAAARAEPGNSAIENEIISKFSQPLPGNSLVPQARINFVLSQVASIGLKRRPQCQDYRIDQRKVILSEGADGAFKELWVVEICGEKVNFIVTRSRIGFRELHLSVGVEQ